jgi:hypothetical protein
MEGTLSQASHRNGSSPFLCILYPGYQVYQKVFYQTCSNLAMLLELVFLVFEHTVLPRRMEEILFFYLRCYQYQANHQNLSTPFLCMFHWGYLVYYEVFYQTYNIDPIDLYFESLVYELIVLRR